jgi:hypothetical protein
MFTLLVVVPGRVGGDDVRARLRSGTVCSSASREKTSNLKDGWIGN